MLHNFQSGLLVLVTLALLFNTQTSQAFFKNQNGVKSAVFLSPKLVMEPGSVANKYYQNMDFPRSHIALKDLFAEVVDELGNPVPLHETYLHHWLMQRYYTLIVDGQETKTVPIGNGGICQTTLRQQFGLGSETRKTISYVPDPYGMEFGNPADIPDRYEERWALNLHAIDTRGVEDRLGCTECRCDLYNVTVDELGRPLRPGYTGGLYCCYDQTKCRMQDGFRDVKRSIYLRYTVKWVDWDDAVIPVTIYILDVTYNRIRAQDENNSLILNVASECETEYQVESCSVSKMTSSDCIHTKMNSMVMPNGGYVIYGIAHQHTGGAGAALYGEDGRLICASIPIYGKRKEAGNEAGYVVGMSSCYPRKEEGKILDGENLFVESNYSSSIGHTGVMGFLYLLVADQPPTDAQHIFATLHEKVKLFKYSWTLVLVGIVMTIIAATFYHQRNGNGQGYELI